MIICVWCPECSQEAFDVVQYRVSLSRIGRNWVLAEFTGIVLLSDQAF